MGRIGLLIPAVMWGVLLGPAHAFPQDHVTAAREALKKDDRKAIREALDLAEVAFSESQGVAPNDVLASYWYYRGLLILNRGKVKPAMEQFRQALVVDNAYAWDKELSSDTDARRLFEALRSEVRSRDVQSPKVPEKMGFAQAYVDGTQVRAGDWVAVGPRLAQIQCPEGDVHGQWTTFEEDLDWLSMCPYEVDTSVDIYAVTGPPDEFGGLGETFGEPPGAEPAAPQEESATTQEEPVPDDETPVQQESRSTGSLADLVTPRNMVIAGGGGLMATGLIMHFTVVRPAHAMVEWGRRNPHELTRYQADVLTERFVNRRLLTWSVFGVGAGVTAAGVFAMKPTALQPTLFPGGMGLQGKF